MPEIVGISAVETAAIAAVLERERTAGREARDVRHSGALVDIEGDRLIEVKAYGGTARGSDLWLESKQVVAALENPDRFHLVIVENVRQGDPALFRILDVHGDVLAGLLERRREKHYFEVPFSTKVYDSLIREEE